MTNIFAKTIAIATSAAFISVASLILTVPAHAQTAPFTQFSFKTNVTATPTNDPYI
ncbi:hypothetical protein NSTCB13_06071 [Nostoc sp. DSM 114160]